MNLEYKQALLKYGVDFSGALERVAGNETLYERLLLKFLTDMNFTNLKSCLLNGYYQEAYPYAHTLKGLVGNLGFNPLYQLIDPIVTLLKEQKTEGILELFPPFELAYDRLCNIIREHS